MKLELKIDDPATSKMLIPIIEAFEPDEQIDESKTDEPNSKKRKTI